VRQVRRGCWRRRFSFIESRDPSGLRVAPHVHDEAVEALYVLEGAYVFQTADTETELGAGGFALIPKGIRHAYRSLAKVVAS
jgi:quercetin dioxygenase-like cupin family protein